MYLYDGIVMAVRFWKMALKGMLLRLKERDFEHEKGDIFKNISKNTIRSQWSGVDKTAWENTDIYNGICIFCGNRWESVGATVEKNSAFYPCAGRFLCGSQCLSKIL